jgi:hypothetical protein
LQFRPVRYNASVRGTIVAAQDDDEMTVFEYQGAVDFSHERLQDVQVAHAAIFISQWVRLNQPLGKTTRNPRSLSIGCPAAVASGTEKAILFAFLDFQIVEVHSAHSCR